VDFLPKYHQDVGLYHYLKRKTQQTTIKTKDYYKMEK